MFSNEKRESSVFHDQRTYLVDYPFGETDDGLQDCTIGFVIFLFLFSVYENGVSH